MNLLRRNALRAASLVLLLAALAAPAYALPGSPIILNPDSGDPDVGGDNVFHLRHLHQILLLSARRLLLPTAPAIAPIADYSRVSNGRAVKR